MFGGAKMGAVIGLGLGMLAACDSGVPSHSIETMSSGNAVRRNDPVKIARGEQVYREHCAVCHGDKAQGAPHWRQRDADGMFPPPPLNGSGHAWHHSTAELQEMIKSGSRAGQGKMPAWDGKLSDQDIAAAIAWFQSLWPDAVYGEWYAMEQRSFGK